MTAQTPKLQQGGQDSIVVRLFKLIFDIRVIGVIAQIVFVVVVVAFFIWIFSNTAANIDQLGEAQFLCRDGSSSFRCAFDFLSADSQFDISESSIEYEPADSYWRALGVGALNTVKVTAWGILLTTILGTIVGIARLSPNWLISNLAKWYVDLFRNTPLVIQLIFIFFVFFAFFLPNHTEASGILGLPLFLSKRGINYPNLVFLTGAGTFMAFLVLGLIQAQVIWMIFGRIEDQTGKESNRFRYALISFLLVAIIGWVVASRNVSTHGIMAHNDLRIREFSDLELLMERRLSVASMSEIALELEDGTLTQDEVDAAAYQVCSIQDSKVELNFVEQLKGANIPYEVNRESRADKATEAYIAGECDIYVAEVSRLAAERDVLEDSGSHNIIKIDEPPIIVSTPLLQGLNFVGGGKITPAFGAMLIGLVLNTGANVAEIVRAGIQSVSKGQTEAARALGLNESQRLRLVVLPQALTVIIPPQTSQYLNLAKNSSLALAVSYPDFWQVSNTTINQSGRALQVMLLVMAFYLSISLTVSAFLNWYNQRVTLKER